MRALIVGVLLIASSVVAQSADLAQEAPPSDIAAKVWSVKIQTYVWGAALSGDVKPLPRLPVVETDLRFRDILEQLKFAGMTAASVHYGRIGVSGDLQYIVTRSSSKALQPLFSRARVTSKTFIGTFLGDYKAFVDERFEVIASAGGRVYSVDTEVELTPGVLRGRGGSGGDTWVDPFVGLRGNFAVTPKLYTNAWAYAGGFGLGSDFAADLYAGVGYRFTDRISTTLGYRWLRVDRDTGGFIYDVTQQGLMAGLVIEF